VEAMSAGMALGAAPGSDVDALAELQRRGLAEADRVVLVADRDGELVGMAQLVRSGAANARHRAEVQRVAVAEAARGTGIGRELMGAIEEEARRLGLTLLWLTTHAGSAAEAFYESAGYARLGVMPEYSQRPDGTLAPGAFFYRRL
jgi:acetyltransferase